MTRLCILTAILAGAANGAEPRQAYLDAHCAKCHGDAKPKGEFRISDLKWPVTTPAEMERWKTTADRIGAGEMPPKSAGTPPAKDTQAVLEAIHTELTRAEKAIQGTPNGAFRRLNRFEYQQTLVDLLGIRAAVWQTLPEDAVAHHFDRVGSALTLSGEHLRLYMAAAEEALFDCLPDAAEDPASETRTGTIDSTRYSPSKKAREERTDLIVHPEGGVVLFHDPLEFADVKPKVAGRYKVRIAHAAYQTEDITYSELNFGTGLARYIESNPGAVATTEVDAWLSAGQTLSLKALLDTPKRPFRSKWTDYKGPGVWVKGITLEGPLPGSRSLTGYRALFGDLPMKKGADRTPTFWTQPRFAKKPHPVEAVSKDPAADARRLMAAFLPKAFRRPVRDEEVTAFAKMATDSMAQTKGRTFHDAMMFAYVAVLTSPDFLFFAEKPGKLDDYAIASRLSYFLTSSLPDEELTTAARAGKLKDAAERTRQAQRLLNSPRADRFVTDFAGQWLELNQIEATTPDAKLYPEFDRVLLRSSVAETEAYFREILKEDRSLLEFVRSDWAMLNSRLANLYGIPGVSGMALRKVPLPAGSPRGGVLTQASVLKVTANGTITSPVKRGKWVLERIVGRPPAPPPPNVPMIEPDVRGATTIREQFAVHRSNESCAGCHAKLDPHGFALESFDVIGTWRDSYRVLNKTGAKPKVANVEYRLGAKVDAADTLAAGDFKTVGEYKALLLLQKEQITRNLAANVFVYALGREPGYADAPTIDAVVKGVAAKNHGLRTLILDLVRSEAFITK